MKRYRLRVCSILLGVSFVLVPAITMSSDALQTAGEPGSPSSTTTIKGDQIPPMPDETFGGKIERNAIAIDTLLAAPCCAAEGCAQHSSDHDR